MYERTPNQDRLDAFVRDVRERYALSRLRTRSTAELEAARAAVEREIERFAASFPDDDRPGDDPSPDDPHGDRTAIDPAGPAGSSSRPDERRGHEPADAGAKEVAGDRVADGGVAGPPPGDRDASDPRPLSRFERDRLERLRSETVANVDRLLADRRAESTGRGPARSRTRWALGVASRTLRALVSGRRTA